MSNPKISVCIPSYNCAPFLADAIDSVLAQSYSDFELLIIDDCSTDSSAEIISGYAAKDSRIVYLRNETNLGMVANWNRCIELAKGEYIHYLFADDLFASPECLEKMLRVLEADTAISLVVSARNIIDEDSRIKRVASHFRDKKNAPGTEVIRRCLFEARNLIGEPSVVMFRKSQALRGFHPGYAQFVDLEMWFHLLEQGRFAYLAEPLASFRDHPGQQTKVNMRRMLHIDESFLLLRDFAEKPYMRFSAFTRWYLTYSQGYRIWKLYRQGLISRETAEGRITNTFEMGKFRSFLPVYKIVNPLFKLRGSLLRD
jgi:glycosyltransferase involved in cell wall biosynthesis